MKKLLLITTCLLLLAGFNGIAMAQDNTSPSAASDTSAPAATAPTTAQDTSASDTDDGLPTLHNGPGGWTVHGSVTGGLEYFWEDNESAKFNEYRYEQSEPWGGCGSIKDYAISPDGSHRIDFSALWRSPQDINIDLESQAYGKYRFDFGYQRFGHVFAYDVKTIYNGLGTGNLTINPATKAAIMAGVAPPQTTAGLQTIASNLNSVLATDANTADIELRRDRINTDLDLSLLWPLDVDLGFNYENRTGDRPYGGTFGFGNAIEIAEPINYDTYDANAGLEYANKTFYANLKYYHSSFFNHIQSLTYENPFIFTDSAGGEGSTYGAGSVFGRNALPPSNYYDNLNGAFAVNLPLNSRALFIGSYAWSHQNSPLIDPTVNTATTGLIAMPRTRADAEVESKQFEVRLTSEPIKKLSTKIDLRYFDHTNNTPVETFPAVAVDSGTASTSTPEYNSWITRSLEAEAAYEFLPRTNFGVNYEYDGDTYFYDFSRTLTQNTWKFFLDTRNLEWLTAKLDFQYSNRESNYPDETDSGQPPYMRKFHMADRDRYMADAIVTVTPTDPLSFSLEYNYGRDRYDDDIFGLQLSKFQTASLDADLDLARWLSVNAFYSFEYNSQSQSDRQSNPATLAGLTDPNSPSNWQLRTRTEIHTVGLGANATLIPDFLKFKTEGTFSKVHGKAFFSSAVGPTASANPADVDLNPFVPQGYNNLDSNEFWRAMAEFKVKLTKRLQASLGYRYERWTVSDYERQGLTYAKTNNVGAYNSLLNMGTLYQPYEVHSVFTTLTYFF